MVDSVTQEASVRTRTEGVWSERLHASVSTVPEVTEDDLVHGVTRDVLIERVLAHDAVLTSLAARVQGLVHAARAEGSLPAPEAGVQLWNVPFNRPWALDASQMVMFEVRQMFPAAGMLDASARAMSFEARAVVAEMHERVQDLTTQVDELLLSRRVASGHHHAHVLHLQWLAAAHEALDARLTGGDGDLAQTARLDADVARIHREIARFDAERRAASARINALLLRTLDAPLGESASAMPVDGTRVETIAMRDGEVMEAATKSRGLFVRTQAMRDAAHARVDAARAVAMVPDFNLGVSVWVDPMRVPGYGVSLGMTLPWLSSQGRERLAQSEWNERSVQAEEHSVSIELAQEVGDALARLHGAENEWLLQHGEVIPAVERSLEASQAAFVADRGGLYPWLEAAHEVLEARVVLVDAAADVSRAVIRVERAVGRVIDHRVVGAEVAR